MADHGTIMSPAMVLASLAGRKTETRRLAWGEDGRPTRWQKVKPGDRLWIREPWSVRSLYDDRKPSELSRRATIDYRADRTLRIGRARSGRFMPRWASRLTYVDVLPRMEPIQAITREGAIAEGLACLSKDDGRTWKYGIPDRDGWPGTDDFGWPWHNWCVDPIEAFVKLWTSLHGQAAWDDNPEVVILPAGKVIHANIDRLPDAA